MFQVQTDTARNVLRIILSQEVERTQARQCREKIEVLLPELQPGFQLLTDLSRLDRMDYACATEIRVIMDLCQKKGVSKVIRVIPDPHKDIGFRLMSFFHYGRDVPIVTCETLAEAEEKLST